MIYIFSYTNSFQSLRRSERQEEGDQAASVGSTLRRPLLYQQSQAGQLSRRVESSWRTRWTARHGRDEHRPARQTDCQRLRGLLAAGCRGEESGVTGRRSNRAPSVRQE
jgi:hypothetical protein